jgi:wyosine [tRNA(Phe)-imidazoG37] synthetase (radical SAM superfamily)
MKNESKNEKKKYVFGPVPSRRLGRSLGVDLIPFKFCTFNCVYCQLGRTPTPSTQRQEYVPMDDVLTQIKEAVANGPRPDYITMAGSGEPTLYTRLGELIDRIHEATDVPVDIITNNSLLWMDEVFNAVIKADLILPSLDAGDEETFLRINRPADGVTFKKLLDGLEKLSKTCPEKVWLEVFIVNGVNDDEAHVRKIAALTRKFQFARVQLNTAVRPPAESEVKPVAPEKLHALAKLFTPEAEIIADFPHPKVTGIFKAHAEAVLEMLKRRPCTLDDIADGMGGARNEIIKAIDQLLNEKKIQVQKQGERDYYLVRE